RRRSTRRGRLAAGRRATGPPRRAREPKRLASGGRGGKRQGTLNSAMQPANPFARLPALWRGKALARVAFLLVVSAVVAALAAAFGIARDYGYLQASILTGSPGGQYHALATRLSERAKREHGTLTVVATAGSIENVRRLAASGGRCAEMFALIQDGTP